MTRAAQLTARLMGVMRQCAQVGVDGMCRSGRRVSIMEKFAPAYAALHKRMPPLKGWGWEANRGGETVTHTSLVVHMSCYLLLLYSHSSD